MKTLEPRPFVRTRVSIPGSKSISHRSMICAALAKGVSTVRNCLESDDLAHTINALTAMGAHFDRTGPGNYAVTGFNGKPVPHDPPIYLGNSGTSMRLLAGIAGLGDSDYILTGDKRMQERPMTDLLTALAEAGISAESVCGTGAPPVRINGKSKSGGSIHIDCSQSSQYLSALLMMGALLPEGLDILLPAPAVSAPYITLTLDTMKRFGVEAEKRSDTRYRVVGKQTYSARDLAVEPDVSNASYFWAMGAVNGIPLKVNDISPDSSQGDLRLLDVLKRMGADIRVDEDGISVCGKDLTGITVDMSDIPDVVPTLAVVAAFARGTTRITHISHLRAKECDRIDAVVSQLQKIRITANQGEDWLEVTGGQPEGAMIETFNDHRIAMAFSVAGTKIPGMVIQNPDCVAKSFPSYWEVFETLVS